MSSFIFIAFFTSECCSYAARDCYDVLDKRERLPGVFSVTPEGTRTSFDVYCDVGGWLVGLLLISVFNL